MFGRMMNNFYYGKSGKGDFRKEDLPTNRWQLFFEMLRVRFGGLLKLNLLSVIAFVPLALVIAYGVMSVLTGLSVKTQMDEVLANAGIVIDAAATQDTLALAEEAILAAGHEQVQADICLRFANYLQSILSMTTLLLIPCIAITGPVQVGMAYVTRNWARDEHAFVWADFKDAVKENWKQSLVVSTITGVVPFMVYICWMYYGQMAQSNVIFMLPQVIVCIVATVWLLSLTYQYAMIVGYEGKAGQLIKNAIMLTFARLPHTIGARLALLVPLIIVLVMMYFTSYGLYALLVLALYYLLIGNALSRFVSASMSNAAFDRLINVHIEGAKINQGLSDEDDWDDEDEENQDA